MNSILKIGLFIVLISGTYLANGQVTRAAYRAQLEAYQKTANQELSLFFDRTQATDTRIAALRSIDVFTDKTQAQDALEIVLDTSQPDALRAAAIFKVRMMIHQMEQPREQVLNWVRQSYTPPQFRTAAMDVLQMALFKTKTPEAVRNDIIATFRTVAYQDTKPEFREKAMYALVNYGDMDARKVLGDGLKNPSSAVLSQEKAVTLLSGVIQGSNTYYALILGVLEDPDTPEAQLAALRTLGDYTPAREAITAILQDKKASDVLRITGLNNLNATLNDKEYLELIEPIITNEAAPEKLRIQGLKSQYFREIRLQKNRSGIKASTGSSFKKIIEQVQQNSSSAAVKTAAKKYQIRLGKGRD